jgi:hypothetical protein
MVQPVPATACTKRCVTAEDRPGAPGDVEDDVVGGDRLAVVRVPGELHVRIEVAEGRIDPRPAREHGALARDHTAAHPLRRRHQRRGDIAAADVLAQRRLDLFGKIARRLGHGRSRVARGPLTRPAQHGCRAASG